MAWRFLRRWQPLFPRDPILGPLEDALVALRGASPLVDLELPDPEVGISQSWADGIRQTAEHVAARQQEAIVRRHQRRIALHTLQQIRRGVDRITTIEQQAVEEAHQINEVAQSLSMRPLEIVSEEEQDIALRALRRANEQAEGTI